MELSLAGKTAIVTGSIQGIGKQIAATLSACGASVIINNHRDGETLEKVAQEISSNGPVKAVVADVSKKESAQKLIDAADEFGGVDILVNNAGGLVKRVPVAEFDNDHFDTIMDINLKTSFIMANLAIPSFKKKNGGKVINLSSQAAHDGGGPGAAAYAASKGGIWTFTKALAKELGPIGVCVNCVSPGFIGSTAFHNTFTSKEVQEKMPSMILLGRVGEAADIANVVLFLASDLSNYMTGQSLEVNGGLYMP
ncbi:MAG: SDR family NAD(P)-dependent oxidoreductase [Calditrichaeota bacterium]|nr:MAG: SDR family NAD(P)-dependent oxidoreductase [Calditrichota bacterium]